MPASLAVRAHWSVSQPVARKAAIFFTPGVHSVPEKVLNDQQTNMPQFRFLAPRHAASCPRLPLWASRNSKRTRLPRPAMLIVAS